MKLPGSVNAVGRGGGYGWVCLGLKRKAVAW